MPVHVATDLTPAQIKAYRIADNQTATIADWDFDLLPLELADLQGLDFDLDLLGFDAGRTGQAAAARDVQEGLTDPDDVPAPPDEAITQPGDLWILGDHRLLCGDSSKPGGRGPAARRSADPPGEHRPAVQREGRAAQQQRHRRGQQLVLAPTANADATTSRFDLARHPEKAKPTGKKLRAKDRPLANDFVTDEAFDRAARCLVRQHGPRAGAGPRLLHLGRLRQPRQLPAVPQEARAVLQPGRSSGTSSIRC